MLGIRVSFLTLPQRRWLADGTVDWFWAAAEVAGLPLMALPPDQVSAIDLVAEKYPGLRLVIDHLGMTSIRQDTDAFSSLNDVCPLARHPNVAVKATALHCYTTQRYPFVGIHKHIRRVFEAFGPERGFWEPPSRGSPVPIARRSHYSPRN